MPSRSQLDFPSRRAADTFVAPPVAGAEPPDVGGRFATAASLELNEVFQGTVNDGTDRTDMFRVTASQEGVLAFSLGGLTGPVSVQVFTSGRQLIGSAQSDGSGELSVSVLAAGGQGFFVAVTAGSPAMLPYQLVVGYAPFTGSPEPDTLTGTAGDDMMAGLAGDDNLSGRQGNDTIHGGTGDDTLAGGSGDDLMVGGLGANLLYGGSGNDTLYSGDAGTQYGGGGDDRLFGLGGDDLIFGDAGRDWITGSTGHDTLYGGDDGDTLYGTYGDDILFGGASDDLLHGDQGSDTLWGGSGDDVLDGGAGHDSLTGGEGADYLIGGPGSDTLSGGAGDDRLFAGMGPVADKGLNRLYAGDGADTLYGAEGRDILDLGAADSAADVVVVRRLGDSGIGRRADRIDGFERGLDRIDFSLLDTDPMADGRQPLAWGDTTATVAGLWWRADGADVLLFMDGNGNGEADSVWRITGLSALSQDDLLL